MAAPSISTAKERHRQAIVAAAGELISDSDGTRFTAEDLAERAGFSRRTVFNHFGSLDEVLIAVCADTLRSATAEVLSGLTAGPVTGPGRGELFTRLTRALTATVLADPILHMWRALAAVGADEERAEAFAQNALAVVAEELSARLTLAAPDADPFDVQLLAGLLNHGLGVVARTWVDGAPAGGDPDPADLQQLLDRLLDTLGHGYLPRDASAPTDPPVPSPGTERE